MKTKPHSTKAFFYQAYILRDQQQVCRMGTVIAQFPLDALDNIVRMAEEEWKRVLVKIELFDRDNSGDHYMVATTTMNHSDAQSKSIAHHVVNPGQYHREQPEFKKLPTRLAWSGSDFGNYYSRPSYGLYKGQYS